MTKRPNTLTHHASRIAHHGLRFTIYAVTIFLALLIIAPVQAQSEVSDDDVNAIAKDIYCPVCESTPLDACPTQACADWREVIRTQLAEGRSEAEIKAYFARQYGDRVLAEPPRRGLNLILWIGPIVALLVGGGVFVWYVRGIKTADSPAPSTPSPTNKTTPSAPTRSLDDYIKQVEEEL